MHAWLDTVNGWSGVLVTAGWAHFVQLTILAGVLLLIDLTLGRRLGPAWRFALWLLFFVKLVLPPGLALPTSPLYWREVSAVSTAGPTSPAGIGPSAVNEGVAGEWASPPASIASIERELSESSASTRVAVSWPAVGMLLWVGGVLAVGTLTLRRHRTMARLLARSRAAGPELEAALTEACRRVGVAGPVGLRLSPRPLAPLVTGLRRPVIHLPEALVARLSSAQLHAVLVHELVHVKRRDLWVAAGQSVARVLCFYHPVLWWVNARLARLREQATDRAVLACREISARTYSLALLETAAFVAASGSRSPFALGVIETKTHLQERITMNLHPPRSGRAQLGLGGLISIVLLGLLLLPMMAAPAAPRAVEQPSETFTAIDPSPIQADVDQAVADIYDAFNRRDRAAFLRAFVPHPIILPDQAGLLTGRSGVTEMVLRTPMGLQYANAHWGERAFYEIGDWVLEAGTVAFNFRLNVDAPVMTDPRSAFSIWQREPDGRLRVKLLSWNSLGDRSELEGATRLAGYTAPAPTRPFSSDGDFGAVLAAEETFHHAFEIHELDTAAGFYAEGASLFLPSVGPLHGRQRIADYLNNQPPEQIAKRIEREVIHLEGSDDLVLVVNLFRWSFLPRGAAMPVPVVGKGVHVWERDAAGEWHILFDLPNASQPTS